MPDREKVISGLRSIKTYLASQAIESTDDFAREGFIESQKDIDDAIALLKEQEALVRCKDCKWWDKKDGSSYGYCNACKHGHHSEHWEIGIYRLYKGDWFCADGEKAVSE